MSENKSCPFCGNEKIEALHMGHGCLAAYCYECEAEGPPRSTEAEAMEAWNRRAPAVPVISEAQVLAITTAYEQGVGKGHQSHARKEAITNPYGDEWGCDSAWQMGYDEGREQAAKQGGV